MFTFHWCQLFANRTIESIVLLSCGVCAGNFCKNSLGWSAQIQKQHNNNIKTVESVCVVFFFERKKEKKRP